MAVLYDYRNDAIACAGEFSAETTSDFVMDQRQLGAASGTAWSALEVEFDAEVERAIARSLRHRARRMSQGEPESEEAEETEETRPEENR